jgi:hypothetical protein
VPRRIRGSGGQYLVRRVLWALVCLWGTTALGQAPSGRYITLEWDPSPNPMIVGYIVYVGTAPRRYTEIYVVRSRTYFVYPNAVPEQQYYFAVAAYAGGPLIDPLIGVPSEEVSGFGQSTPARPLEDPLPDQFNSLGVQTATSGRLCPDSANARCHNTPLVAAITSPVSAIAATSDGRLFVVEDGQRVRVLERNAFLPEAALVAPRSNVRFAGLVLGPDFVSSHRVFVAETEVLDDGTRDLRIVRYREVQNALGERAVIVNGIRIAATGGVPFTVDSNNRIFVAVPSTQNRSTPYSGLVLGFESDGSALRQNRAASPIVAQGFARPTAILWDASTQQLWLSGVDVYNSGQVARVPLDSSTPTDWPRVPQPAVVIQMQGAIGAPPSLEPNELRNTPIMLLPLPEGTGLVRVRSNSTSVTEVPHISDEEITAVTAAPADSAYIAVRDKGGQESRILRVEQP